MFVSLLSSVIIHAHTQKKERRFMSRELIRKYASNCDVFLIERCDDFTYVYTRYTNDCPTDIFTELTSYDYSACLMSYLRDIVNWEVTTFHNPDDLCAENESEALLDFAE
jgi:hypothetical protein